MPDPNQQQQQPGIPAPPKPKKRDDGEPLLQQMLDQVIPRGPGAFLKRILVFRVLLWLVEKGLLPEHAANKIKHPNGTPAYIPRRQKISAGGEEVVAGQGFTDEEAFVLGKLMYHAFPADAKPSKAHYNHLVGQARMQGISAESVDAYLLSLLDTECLAQIGLIKKEDR